MDYKMLRVSKKNNVATITLDWAPTLNALDLNMAIELEDALKAAEEDDEVKVVILTGAGRAFCGGGDIRFMKEHCMDRDFVEKSMGPLVRKLSKIVLYIKKMKKLVLCAVKGAAAGGGCNLAFGCDMVFAAHNAKFLQAFIGIALVPDTGGGYLLPRMVGCHKALEMFVSGRPMLADEALRLAIVTKLFPDELLLDEVTSYAEKLAKGPTLAYTNIKKMMFESMYKDFEAFAEKEAELQGECELSEDFREGITAFLEKRKPAFTGK